MKRIAFFVSGIMALLFVAELGMAADFVKKSRSGICHCPEGQYYKRTQNFKKFPTVEACIKSGGRHPKRGQGPCQKTKADGGAGQDITGPARVIDGDTVEVQGERIRLQGIDAPEKRQTCTDKGCRWKCGLEASMALIDRIAGRDISCAIEGRGKYGRAIGVCSMNGEDLNAWMVGEGWALAYVRYSKAYINEEARAKSERRGIWRGRFVKPWEWRRGKRVKP